MRDTKDLVIGMKRALNACENCDGDLDFAIYIIKRDIAEMEKESVTEAAVLDRHPKAVLQNNSVPMFRIVNGPESVVILSDWHLDIDEAWADAYAKLPAPESETAGGESSKVETMWRALTSEEIAFGKKPDVVRCAECKVHSGFHSALCKDTSRYEVPQPLPAQEDGEALPPLVTHCPLCGDTGKYNDHECQYCALTRLSERERQLREAMTLSAARLEVIKSMGESEKELRRVCDEAVARVGELEA